MTTPAIKRVMGRADLILFGLVILTPTAPYPVYGIIQQVSHGHAALSYLVALVAMLFTAGSYAKMSSAFPSAGSTYTYVQQTMSPFLGFLAGWAMILDYFLIPLVSIVYAAITAARLWPHIPYAAWVIIFSISISVVNMRGVRAMAWANSAMMTVMTAVAIVFIGLCARYIAVHLRIEPIVSLSKLLRPESLALRPIMQGAGIATLSYIGFDAISTLAEDTRDPERDIGFSTIMVCVLQGVICIITVHLAALVWPDYNKFPDANTAILDLATRLGGQIFFGILTFVLLVAGLASALTGQAGASRLLFAMGRDGTLSLFCQIDPRFGTPTRAILAVTLVSMLGGLALHFEILVELLNFGAFVGFILVNLSVIQHYYVGLKRRAGLANLYHLAFPACGALVCGYVWLSLSLDAKIVGFSWLLIGTAYFVFRTQAGVKVWKATDQ